MQDDIIVRTGSLCKIISGGGQGPCAIQYSHKISDAVNCETKNCVYYWRCKYNPKCEFRTRMGEHKQNVRSQNLETPSGFHFNQPGHDVSHLAGLVLDKVESSDPFFL